MDEIFADVSLSGIRSDDAVEAHRFGALPRSNE